MTKRFDLVLFGATGFTGRQTLLYLARHVPQGLRWAIGGRDQGKLQWLLEDIADCKNQPEILIADVTDAASVAALVAQAHVVIQLAGPYSPHGESFIAACTEHATHYLDLTAELVWVRQMADRYHAAAKAAKTKLVPSCGFESLPYDMAALLAAQHLVKKHGVRASEIRIVTRFTGPRTVRPADLLSGGTTASIVTLLRDSGGEGMTDPAILVDSQTRAEVVRARNPYVLKARQDEASGAWLAPMVPAPFINPAVIHRSAALLASARTLAGNPFTDDLHYEEYLSMAGLTPFKAGQRMAAEAMARSFEAMRRASTSDRPLFAVPRQAAARLIQRFGPKSGEGPSDEMLEKSGYEMDVTARGTDGAQISGIATALGHPGYRSTAGLVAEAGLLLATQAAALPKRYGLLTPASAFGSAPAVMQAFERAGLTFAFED